MLPRARPTIPALITGLVFVVVGVGVGLRWLDVPNYRPNSLNHYFAARAMDMVDGQAYRPHVTRALVPLAIRAAGALPREVTTPIRRAVVRTLHLRPRLDALGWEPARTFEYLVLSALTLGGFVVVPFAMRATFRRLFRAHELWSSLIPLAFLCLLPPLFFRRWAHYVYDPATLALWAVATWALAARRPTWFYACYALAVVNKETALLLAVVYVLAAPAPRPWRPAAALGTLWLVVRASISWLYRHNPGDNLDFRQWRNLAAARDDPAGIALLALAVALVAASLWTWRSIRLAWPAGAILAGTFLAAYLVVGNWDEHRFFYEVAPLVWVLTCAALLRWCGAAVVPRS